MAESGEGPAKRMKTEEAQRPAYKSWKFMTAWFCPYAQRAWIALNHHAVPFERHESLSLKIADGESLRDALGYDKTALLLKHNPAGLVPTIVDSEEAGPAIHDSLTCVEFADDLARSGGAPGGTPLLPQDPVLRARARMSAEWVNKSLCSPFYKVLVLKDQSARRENFAKLVEGFQQYQADIAGPYFLGERLSIVDIAAIPWAYRILTCRTLEVYRGEDFKLEHGRDFSKLRRWLDACLALESVQRTLAEPQPLVDTYKRYADGTAQSKVAEAVRTGGSAHDV